MAPVTSKDGFAGMLFIVFFHPALRSMQLMQLMQLSLSLHLAADIDSTSRAEFEVKDSQRPRREP